ncbi:MAG TPA: hypothetical protein VHB21_11095 [Minicystis sp.]|nr:hypothetical protein [Minicystis sp.]
MARNTKRPRAERRRLERAASKLGRDLERVAAFERGGAPDRPISLASAAEVEVHARGVACARCRGPTELLEHAAETHGGARLRVVRLRCKACGASRSVYYRLPEATLH